MDLFFDTSALIPLVLEQQGSEISRQVWNNSDDVWAWDWMRVEGEAALSRRKANAEAWAGWRRAISAFSLIGLGSEHYASLCAFNRGLALRAADAGHLFVFDQLLQHVPQLKLFTFDEEMKKAAQKIGLPIHDPS